MKNNWFLIVILGAVAFIAWLFYQKRGTTFFRPGTSTGTATNSPNEDISNWQRMLSNLGLRQSSANRTAETITAISTGINTLPGLFRAVGNIFRPGSTSTPTNTTSSGGNWGSYDPEDWNSPGMQEVPYNWGPYSSSNNDWGTYDPGDWNSPGMQEVSPNIGGASWDVFENYFYA